MKTNYKSHLLILLILAVGALNCNSQVKDEKPRIIVTSDGEIDDECSMVRFLLYSNEWDVEGMITTSSEYHWKGHNWAGENWIDPYLQAYSEVYPNLILHDKEYPSPDYLKSIYHVGNIEYEGEMDTVTAGSTHLVKVLLDIADSRPVWIQAWGGTNTIARALKTIEIEHPERMQEVAEKIRLFLIWEQDATYQSYIRPQWEQLGILTIISDQFWALGYQWDKILPEDKRSYFEADWMKSNILQNHGALCSLYPAFDPSILSPSGGNKFEIGDFRSEGDSPAFLHMINTGLRSLESPDFGGWGGRYALIRNNTWMDPVPIKNYEYPEGRWYGQSAWGRMYMRERFPDQPELMEEYFRPLVRWTDVMQNDFAARADWCVLSYDEANHPPKVKLNHERDLNAKAGDVVQLNASGTFDPDGDSLKYTWWHYKEADGYKGNLEILDATTQSPSILIPRNIEEEISIHIICEVVDNGTPPLTRYERIVLTIKP